MFSYRFSKGVIESIEQELHLSIVQIPTFSNDKSPQEQNKGIERVPGKLHSGTLSRLGWVITVHDLLSVPSHRRITTRWNPVTENEYDLHQTLITTILVIRRLIT
jgi:hypothetical protein